ncbi:MAG: hypothetical protein EXR76_18195 [Myxococcales bacterium]|nr:hypothetical protein [Myxococcales bacterium]
MLAAITAALRRLVGSAGVTIEHDAIVRRANTAFEAGPADSSDDLIRESSREAGALPVLTFDERFARGPGVELVPGMRSANGHRPVHLEPEQTTHKAA